MSFFKIDPLKILNDLIPDPDDKISHENLIYCIPINYFFYKLRKMILTNSLLWFDSISILMGAITFFLFYVTILAWKYKNILGLEFARYRGIQRIHIKETPRLGGLIIVFSVWSYSLFTSISEIKTILHLMLISLLPCLLVAFREDLFHDMKPRIRLISLLISALFFLILYKGPFPLIELPYIGEITLPPLALLVLYSFAMLGIANGMNLIDGVNALSASTALSILGSILFLAHHEKDSVMLAVTFIIMLNCFIFLLFNYPWGRIFLGDLGAYSLGMISSMLIIIFYARHPNLPSLGAVLILIYPATEVIFSLVRRLLNGTSPYRPDKEHMHLKIFQFFRAESTFKRVANTIVTPLLSIFWLFPLIVMPWVYQKPAYIIIASLFFVMAYLYIYKKLNNLGKTQSRNKRKS